MNNTTYKIFVSILFLIGIIACKNDDLSLLSTEFSDAVAAASGKNIIERGDFTSFVDLSKGVVKRTWSLPESATILNLKNNDTSKLEIIHVRFDEPGIFNVNLKSEFKIDSVTLNKTFRVTVLDYIKAKLEVKSINSSFFEESPNQITIYEGGEITFSDVSTGEPNRRVWRFDGGYPDKAGGIGVAEDKEVKNVTVSYQEIGIYDVELISWRKNPDGEPDTILLNGFINVIGNPNPPQIVNVKTENEKIIHLKYDLGLKLRGDISSNFTLKVDGEEVEIASVVLSREDNQTVEIVSSEKIKWFSDCTLSYDGQGELTSKNNISAEMFLDLPLIFDPINIANEFIYGFENGGEGWIPAAYNVGKISFTTEKAATGIYSMKMESVENVNWTAVISSRTPFLLEANKKYSLEFKIWIDPSSTSPMIFHTFTGKGISFNEQNRTEIINVPKGEWVTINKVLGTANRVPTELIRQKIWAPVVSGEYFLEFRFAEPSVFYIDDIVVFEVD